MATATSLGAPSILGPRAAALLIVSALALYFVYDNALRYFVWSEASYGYFWQYRVPLIMHVTGGLVALLTGLFQLWSGFNARSMSTHPHTGRLYVIAVIVGGLAAVTLALTSAASRFPWAVGLLALALAWLVTTGVAVYCVRRRDIRAHREWMMRSYIVTFAFVTFRIITDYVPYEALWGISRTDMSNAVLWPAWVLPLLGYQVYLQLRNT